MTSRTCSRKPLPNSWRMVCGIPVRPTHAEDSYDNANRALTVQAPIFGITQQKRAPNLTIQRSSVSAPSGTRTLGPLIKRNQRATIVNFQNYADSLFLSFYREFEFCISCILCTCYPLLHPLSSRSGVQKVCKNVQSQNQPLKTGIGFLCKAGKPVRFEPKTAAEILPV